MKKRESDVIKTLFGPEQDTSDNNPSSSLDPSESRKKEVDEYMISDNTLNAEILWCSKVVMNHFSYNSSEGLSKLFVVMFPDSGLAAHFPLGKNKCTYMLVYGMLLFLRRN